MKTPTKPTVQPEPIKEAAAPPVKVDAKTAAKKIPGIFKEYVDALDFNEVKQCISELGSSDYNVDVVGGLLVVSANSNPKKGSTAKPHERLADCLGKLWDSKIVSTADVRAGFDKFMLKFGDIEMDAPKTAEYVGTALATMICKGILSLAYLNEDSVLQSPDLVQYGSAKNFFGQTAAALKKMKGGAFLVEQYKSSGVDMKKLVKAKKDKSPAEMAADFLRKKGGRMGGIDKELLPLL